MSALLLLLIMSVCEMGSFELAIILMNGSTKSCVDDYLADWVFPREVCVCARKGAVGRVHLSFLKWNSKNAFSAAGLDGRGLNDQLRKARATSAHKL